MNIAFFSLLFISCIHHLVPLVRSIFFADTDTQFFTENSIFPDAYDVMLTDLNATKIADIAWSAFGFKYNSLVNEVAKLPIKGVVLVQNYRSVAEIIVKYKRKIIKTLAIVDTGSPFVYLSEETLKALGIVDSFEANLIVHGEITGVYRSTNHFSGLNVLGASFLVENKLVLNLNYGTRKLSISRYESLTALEQEEL